MHNYQAKLKFAAEKYQNEIANSIKTKVNKFNDKLEKVVNCYIFHVNAHAVNLRARLVIVAA